MEYYVLIQQLRFKSLNKATKYFLK